MIDLKVEQENFEEYMNQKCSRFVDVRRVLNGDIGEYMAWDMTLGFKIWVEQSKRYLEETNQLKQKIAQLEALLYGEEK